MCCFFLILVFLGPRIAGPIWWIFQPLRWEAAFREFASGDLWWIWPILGIVFLPWTTIMYVLAWGAVDGVSGAGWLLVALGVVLDIASYSARSVQSRYYQTA